MKGCVSASKAQGLQSTRMVIVQPDVHHSDRVSVLASICPSRFRPILIRSFTIVVFPLPYELLLRLSVNLLLKRFNIYEGILVLDDTGKKRSKTTQRIPYIHYFKSPDSSGTIRGQEIVLLALVTPTITIPIVFEYYQPDPEYSRWAKVNKRLKKQGVAASKRPKRPPVNSLYPQQTTTGLNSVRTIRLQLPAGQSENGPR